MPTPGHSLVGFMTDQQHALNHLKLSCFPDPNKSDVNLIADWQTAQAKLGSPIPRAGNPFLTPIPQTDPHIQQLLQAPWATAYLAGQLAQGASFQMVEIHKLLAFQFAIDSARSNSHCNFAMGVPNQQELLDICLPLTLSNDPVHISNLNNSSFILKSRSLNFSISAQGPMPIQNAIGIQCAWSLPFVHVTRLNGRCYLHNGFHRALGIRLAGAGQMPCFFRDVADAAAVGILPTTTFDLQLLESANPPTLEHYATGRALDVNLRASARVIQISWSQHTMFDE
jgi:hypothetical protein